MQLQHRSDDSAALDEGPISKLANGLLQLGLRVHHDGSIPGDGLPKRFPRDEQKPDSLFASLNRDLIATVEENERAIAGGARGSGLRSHRSPFR